MVFSIPVDVDKFCSKISTTLAFWKSDLHHARDLSASKSKINECIMVFGQKPLKSVFFEHLKSQNTKGIGTLEGQFNKYFRSPSRTGGGGLGEGERIYPLRLYA